MCQFEMLFAWLTFCFSLLKNRKKCYCFPTFKDLLPLRFARGDTPCSASCTRFFERSAKVRGQLLLPKFSPEIFRSFWCDIQFVLWRTARFLITGSKDKGCGITTKLFCYISLFTHPIISQNPKNYLPFFLSERAAKIGLYFFLPNLFWNKHSLRLPELFTAKGFGW